MGHMFNVFKNNVLRRILAPNCANGGRKNCVMRSSITIKRIKWARM
jgi:hypothetical protein